MAQEISSDVRFGSTFIDVTHEDKAINGEVLSDKQDAELYLKRPADGRVVAYSDKVASIYQILSEINIEFQTYFGYKYPSSPYSALVVSKFKTNRLTEGNPRDIDITQTNLVFPITTLGKTFQFNLSGFTNAFFIKSQVRHVDRNLLGYLTASYKKLVLDNGEEDFANWLTNSPLYGAGAYDTFTTVVEHFEDSTAIIDYDVVIQYENYSGEHRTKTISASVGIRLNEQSFVSLPTGFDRDCQLITSMIVTVKKLSFPKLQYAYARLGLNIENGSARQMLKGFAETDFMVVVRDSSLFYFIDNENDRVPETDYMTTYYYADHDFVLESLDKVSAYKAGGVYARVSQPDDKTWVKDSMWVEETRKITTTNKPNDARYSVTDLGSAMDQRTLEAYIYTNSLTDSELTLDQFYPDGTLAQLPEGTDITNYSGYENGSHPTE